MYTTEGMANEFRQGEIISDLRQPIFDAATNGTFLQIMPFSIVLAHDCDMVQDYKSRMAAATESMNGLLIYEMATESEARAVGSDGRAKINAGTWRTVEKNNHERYHCLEAAPSTIDLAGVGLPLLLIDFRRYFTVSAREIERQIREVKNPPVQRRCRLDSPYREHLQVRAAFYFQRIILPDRPD